ncbi:fetuin B [Osmerus eperlanus]|uniref:fetuin B n=1 Tax=Osmerus eperlanus TaxID=29151 RepID=UPI002E0F09D2
MKQCFVLLLACVCTHGAPLDPGLTPGSCQDASALGAAGLALTKINEDRKEGFVYSLHRLSNVHQMQHAETGTVFYLTLDVLETNCHVFSMKDWRSCAAREISNRPVYGQCKATIYINKIHRVVRLYNYNCVVRPAAATKIGAICPDCPSSTDKSSEGILKAATLSMDKFNAESGQANYFAMVNVTRASLSMGMATFYLVEYTIQETTCANSTDRSQAAKCPLMECEFAHKGHCKGSNSFAMGNEHIDVDCEIFEPQSAEKEKRLHLLGGETDHSHTDGHSHDPKHDHAHAPTDAHTHDHAHDHTKDAKQGHDHGHAEGEKHDHTKPHAHDHDHEHAHHAKAHDHSKDVGPHQHHQYAHGNKSHTHEHDHELALDHDHNHAHLHEHEHHHHHHEHSASAQRQPEGKVTVLPALDRPMTLPAFPDEKPAGPGEGVTLPLVPDAEIPGEREPTILPSPSAVSPQCPAPTKEEEGGNFMKILFAEDPLFKATT